MSKTPEDYNAAIWRKKPNRKGAQNTVTAILDAARELFNEPGFYRTTTNHIAERAGVGIGSVYDYFPNREAIAAALLEETASSISADVRDLFSQHLDDDLESVAPLIFGSIFHWYKAHQSVLINLVEEVPELRQSAQALSIDSLISSTSRLYIKQHQDELSVDNIETAHNFLSMTVVASIKRYLTDRRQSMPEDVYLYQLSRMAILFLRANDG